MLKLSTKTLIVASVNGKDLNGGIMSLTVGDALQPKTKQLIMYLIEKHAVATVTSLVKLCYLSDLVYYQRESKQISDLNYIRWHYGPYDPAISRYIMELVNEKAIVSDIQYTSDGNEYYRYRPQDQSYDKSLLSKDEIEATDAVLNSLVGYGAHALVEVAYKTKPMKALNATIGGTENLGEKLDLSIA